MLQVDDLNKIVSALWTAHGGPAEPITLTPCVVSGNNRVYRVDTQEQKSIIAKFYFRPNLKERNRLHAEWQFLSFAELVGLNSVPRAIAFDNGYNLALHSFVEGKKIGSEAITESHVVGAADFIRTLNADRTLANNSGLPLAAEACFTVADQIALVKLRLSHLSQIDPCLPVDEEAKALILEVKDCLQCIESDILGTLKNLGIGAFDLIKPHERVLSPSDFGFHNIVVDETNMLHFIDFEYAGWDDVAKLVADFFLQPAVPVPSDFFYLFLDRLLLDQPFKVQTAQRIRLMSPLYGIKWVCILLNIFRSDMTKKYRFANPEHDQEGSKKVQYAKALTAFEKLKGNTWHI